MPHYCADDRLERRLHFETANEGQQQTRKKRKEKDL